MSVGYKAAALGLVILAAIALAVWYRRRSQPRWWGPYDGWVYRDGPSWDSITGSDLGQVQAELAAKAGEGPVTLILDKKKGLTAQAYWGYSAPNASAPVDTDIWQYWVYGVGAPK